MTATSTMPTRTPAREQTTFSVPPRLTTLMFGVDGVLRGGNAVPGPADDRPAAASVVRRVGDGVEHEQSLLPGRAAAGLCVHGQEQPPGAPTPAHAALRRSASATAGAAAGPAVRRGTPSGHVAGAVAAAHVGRRRRCAVPRAGDHRSAAAETVLVARAGPLLRSLLPVRSQQPRKLRRPPRVPVPDRAVLQSRPAGAAVVDRLRRVHRSHRMLSAASRRQPPHGAGGDRCGSGGHRSRVGGSSTQSVSRWPGSSAGPRSPSSVCPDARGDLAHHDRHRRDPAVVGSPSGDLPRRPSWEPSRDTRVNRRCS